MGVWLCVLLPSSRKPIYSHRVATLLARDLRDQEVRVNGELVAGSLCRAPAGHGYHFAITDSGGPESSEAGPTVLAVHYEGCCVPDTFRDVPGYRIGLTVQGELCQTCHEFEATHVMAKCSGKYEIGSYADAADPTTPIPPCAARRRPRL